jgi:transcriptional regulator with XRE-family HTH domain
MVEESGLHERLAAAVGQRTYRAVADMTGTNAETVRRYMQGQSPSVEFLASVCAALHVNAHWMLTGQGAMLQSDSRVHALQQANPGELMGAIASALESLTQRIDRIEQYVQFLETRMAATGASVAHGKAPKAPPDGRTAPDPHSSGIDRAARIADAIPRRPRPDAG